MADIEARNLGEILLDDFCPRCLWIRHRCRIRSGHPLFSPMSGIVSTLDAFSKRVVRIYVERTGDLPPWLGESVRQAFPDLAGPFRVLATPRWQVRFGTSIVRGQADCLLEDRSGGILILDYKTARYTANQERLRPLYEAQVNAYAWMMRRLRQGNVLGLGLVYFEPATKGELPALDGWAMALPFHARFVAVACWPDDYIEGLIRQVETVLDTPTPPAGVPGCSGCALYDDWKTYLP